MISMEEKIAIVIPAYKCRFLRQFWNSDFFTMEQVLIYVT